MNRLFCIAFLSLGLTACIPGLVGFERQKSGIQKNDPTVKGGKGEIEKAAVPGLCRKKRTKKSRQREKEIARQNGGAPFIVSEVTGSLETDYKNNLPDEFRLNLRACLRDALKPDSSIPIASFNIKYQTFDREKNGFVTKEISRPSDENGCLLWTEVYPYKYVTEPFWLYLEREIERKTGHYKGRAILPSAVNFWLKERKSVGLSVMDLRRRHYQNDEIFKKHPIAEEGLACLADKASDASLQLWAGTAAVQFRHRLPERETERLPSTREIVGEDGYFNRLCQTNLPSEKCFSRVLSMELRIPLSLKAKDLNGDPVFIKINGGEYEIQAQLIGEYPAGRRKYYRVHKQILRKSKESMHFQQGQGAQFLSPAFLVHIPYININANHKLVLEIKPENGLPFRKFQGVYNIGRPEMNAGTPLSIDSSLDDFYKRMPETADDSAVQAIEEMNIQYVYDYAALKAGVLPSEVFSPEGAAEGANPGAGPATHSKASGEPVSGEPNLSGSATAAAPGATAGRKRSRKAAIEKILREMAFHPAHMSVSTQTVRFANTQNNEECETNENAVRRRVEYIGTVCFEDVFAASLKKASFQIFREDMEVVNVNGAKELRSKKEVKRLYRDEETQEDPKTNQTNCISWRDEIDHENFARQIYFPRKMHFVSKAENLYGTALIAVSPWHNQFQFFQNITDLHFASIRTDTSGVQHPRLVIPQFKSVNLYPSAAIDRLLNLHLKYNVRFLFQPIITRPDSLAWGKLPRSRELIRDGYYLVRALIARSPQETGSVPRVEVKKKVSRESEAVLNHQQKLRFKNLEYLTHTDTVVRVEANFVNMFIPIEFNTEQLLYLASRNLVVLQMAPANPDKFRFRKREGRDEACHLDTARTEWEAFTDHDLVTLPYAGPFNSQNWTNWNILQEACDKDKNGQIIDCLRTDDLIEQSKEGKKRRFFRMDPILDASIQNEGGHSPLYSARQRSAPSSEGQEALQPLQTGEEDARESSAAVSSAVGGALCDDAGGRLHDHSLQNCEAAGGGADCASLREAASDYFGSYQREGDSNFWNAESVKNLSGLGTSECIDEDAALMTARERGLLPGAETQTALALVKGPSFESTPPAGDWTAGDFSPAGDPADSADASAADARSAVEKSPEGGFASYRARARSVALELKRADRLMQNFADANALKIIDLSQAAVRSAFLEDLNKQKDFFANAAQNTAKKIKNDSVFFNEFSFVSKLYNLYHPFLSIDSTGTADSGGAVDLRAENETAGAADSRAADSRAADSRAADPAGSASGEDFRGTEEASAVEKSPEEGEEGERGSVAESGRTERPPAVGRAEALWDFYENVHKSCSVPAVENNYEASFQKCAIALMRDQIEQELHNFQTGGTTEEALAESEEEGALDETVLMSDRFQKTREAREEIEKLYRPLSADLDERALSAKLLSLSALPLDEEFLFRTAASGLNPMKNSGLFSLQQGSFAHSLCGFWFDSYFKDYLDARRMQRAFADHIRKLDYRFILESSVFAPEVAVSDKDSILHALLENFPQEGDLKQCAAVHRRCVLNDYCSQFDFDSQSDLCRSGKDLLARDNSCQKFAVRYFPEKSFQDESSCRVFAESHCRINSQDPACPHFLDRCLVNYSNCAGLSDPAGSASAAETPLEEGGQDKAALFEKAREDFIRFLEEKRAAFDRNNNHPALKTCLRNPYEFFHFENHLIAEDIAGAKFRRGLMQHFSLNGSFSIGSYMNWGAERTVGFSYAGTLGMEANSLDPRRALRWLSIFGLGFKASVDAGIGSKVGGAVRRAIDTRLANSVFIVGSEAIIDIDVRESRKCLVIRPRSNAFTAEYGEDGLPDPYDEEEAWPASFRGKDFKKAAAARPGLLICNPHSEEEQTISEKYYYISQSNVRTETAHLLNLYDIANRPFVAVLRGRKEFIKYMTLLRQVTERRNNQTGEIASYNETPVNLFLHYPHPVEDLAGFSLNMRAFRDTGFHPGVYTYPSPFNDSLDAPFIKRKKSAGESLFDLVRDHVNFLKIPSIPGEQIPHIPVDSD